MRIYLNENLQPKMVMIRAKIIAGINIKVTTKEAIFSQKYILQKGLKIYKEKGFKSAGK